MTPDTCGDLCGDGITFVTMNSTYCDDGNTDDDDGCSSICQVETGANCTGGDDSTADTCVDI